MKKSFIGEINKRQVSASECFTILQQVILLLDLRKAFDKLPAIESNTLYVYLIKQSFARWVH